MNISEITKKYRNKDQCYKYLESIRWHGRPSCPYCNENKRITKRQKSYRHHCQKCNKDFSVLVGTIFENTRLPLPKWFLLIGLILNAKSGISAKELQRNVGIGYPTAWFCAMRVRCAMIDTDNELQNLIEMDESYVGGKPRKKNKKVAANIPILSTVETKNKRGRGTNKTPVVGIVERNGKIVLKVVEKLTSRNLVKMLKNNVNTENSLVMTDEYRPYRKFEDIVEHLSIDHSKGEFKRGIVHLNTIEGFWTIVKNSIRGSYKSLSKKYLPFYLVQAQYIYNHRNYRGDLFRKFIKQAVSVDKCMICYQPKGDVKKIVYKPKKKRS